MTGKHLGDFGERHESTDTFGWFGATMRVGSMGDLVLIDFMQRLGGIEASGAEALEEDPALQGEAAGALYEFFQAFVHEEDFTEFWRLARTNGQRVEDLMALFRALVEAGTSRPTRRRSGSPGGRRSTGAKSTPSGSSTAARRLEAVGRPDLAMAIPAKRRRAG